MSDYKKSSFLDDFEIPVVSHETIKKQLIKVGKVHAVNKTCSFSDMPLKNRLELITKEVLKVLGRYKRFVRVIRTEEELNRYIDKALKFGYLSFDTETNNSLDPLACKLMGLCMYIPNTKPVYVPINHCKPGTEELLENQVSMESVVKVFRRLKDSNIKLIYHNGKFDIRVCYNVTGVYLSIWWDTMIGAQLLDENELAKLKYQYKVHVDPTISTYDIEKLFTGLPYAWIDPDLFALYAAIDAYDTYTLQRYQQSIFEREDMSRLYKLFSTVEIPVVLVTATMEDFGICMDVDFIERLEKKYKISQDDYLQKLHKIMSSDAYAQKIKQFQNEGKLTNPLNYDSANQLQIILYDILKVKPISEDSEESKKSTDKATLKALKLPFTDTVLQYRHYGKLMSGFTTPLPGWLSKKDGKLHANFNQLGKEENNVRTGRFSSTDPNLQQMPSKEKVMRMMFKASTEYADVGIDDDNTISINKVQDVMTDKGWKNSKELSIGNKVQCSDGVFEAITNIEISDSTVRLWIGGDVE